MRSRLFRWFSAVTAMTFLAAMVNVATAGWGSGGGSVGYGSAGYGSTGYGSSGGYTAGYGSSGLYGGSVGGYGSSGGTVRHVGPLRRLHNHIHDKIHNHFARRHSYGSSGGSSGGYIASYGSSGGSSGGSHGSSGGSTGHYAPVSYGSTGSVSYGSTGGVSYGSTGGVSYGSSYMETPIYDASPMYEGTVIHEGVPLGAIQSSSVGHTVSKVATPSSISSNEIHLVVNVPEDAKMFVNGNPTTSTGKVRHFVSRELTPGQSYRFDLKVVVDQDGKPVEKSKVVVLDSGRGEEVTFDLKANDEPVETVLMLNVPEGAKVALGNNNTKTTGSSRTYRTRQLKQGEAWDDYQIIVTYEGKTKEQSIRLIGGDKLELSFNFDESTLDQVAMK